MHVSLNRVESFLSFPSLTIGDLQIPMALIQGGMGIGISLSGLASAVISAGGLGVISAAGIGMNDNVYQALLANRIRAVLWIAVVPAFLCVALIVFGVHEPDDAQAAAPRR